MKIEIDTETDDLQRAIEILTMLQDLEQELEQQFQESIKPIHKEKQPHKIKYTALSPEEYKNLKLD
jgi:hypothetical protein